ncbi:hypothetical protein HPO96_07750 [Kribbella sandramycini]|uniref:Peptidase inhibitor family I36 n=1 Tax=Kribbella sandramycini TaxID=60450 RepID=A0A7Y4KWU6_9ACTN|nr:hypothetical protein [Kribbella sandramycini]MBB6567253.1 hypothetical protein [Kribbella sandramycini]NOL40133.1 hypothetical protein [Kribbella sandramycini]
MTSRILRVAATAGAAVALTAAGGLTATPASAASCYASGGNLYCGNDYNAGVYKFARFSNPSTGNPEGPIDRLHSTHSYFKCWKNGVRHGGGNTVWYYTYGDVSGAWGYVPASQVHTPTGSDPFPGVNIC